MATEYQIAALWMEGRLSFLEELCLKSFVDNGHHVVLYHYGPLENVPEGVELKSAEDILPRAGEIKHERTGSPALHSDIFRYRMLAKEDRTIWADTDAYCRKPFETPNGHFYGWESSKHINGGVLGLPADSDTLGELLAYTADEYSIPPWYGEEYEQQLLDSRDRGDPVHAGDQPWGVWGPHALTYFLHKTGEAKYALPQEGLYPLTFRDRRFMFKPNFDMSPYITENTYSIHLYGRRVRARIAEKDGGVPPRNSLIEKLVQKHGIDPHKSPVPLKPRPADKGRVKAPKPDKTIAEIAALHANRPAELRAPQPVAPAPAPAPAPPQCRRPLPVGLRRRCPRPIAMVAAR